MKITKSDLRLKFKRIVPITALTFLGTTAIYASLRWIYLACGFENIKEEAWRIYLPMLIAAVVTFGILGRRIRIISDNNYSRASPRDLIYLIVLLTGVIMLGTAQGVVTYKTASTTKIESFVDGADIPRSKYYHLTDPSIDLSAWGTHTETLTINERYGSHLQFHLYVVYPFEGQRNIWYGIHFTKDYKQQYVSDVEVQSAYNAFISRCESKLNTRETMPSYLLEREFASNDLDGYLEAVRNAQNFGSPDDPTKIVVLKEVVNIAEDRWVGNANTLIWTFFIGMVLLTLALIFVPIDRKRVNREGKLKANSEPSSLISDFQLTKPENWPIAGIIAIMIGVFVVMTIAGADPISPPGRELMKWGSASHDRVFDGAWGLLVSALFVHGGIMHLVSNLVTFILSLLFAQDLFSGPRIALIFLVTGVCSILAAVIPPHTAVVGASGAIMGIYGAVLTATLSSKTRRKRIGSGFWILTGSVVGFTLILGMSVGVSNTGHITGLLTGGIMGLLLTKKELPHSIRTPRPKHTKKPAEQESDEK